MLQTFCPGMGRTLLLEENRDQVAKSLSIEWEKTDPCVSEKLCEETVVYIYKSVARCAKERPPFERLRN
eukprot:2790404-Amphidinium_carterae.1